MAKPQYNVGQLIENIKRRCGTPTSQLTYKPEAFAALANDALQGIVVPYIMTNREEYFVEYVDVNPPATGIITIPQEAVGAKLRTVAFVQQAQPLLLINLPLMNLDVIAGIGAPFINGLPIRGFYPQDNSIHLYPQNSVPQGMPVRLYYYRRGLVLVPPAQYAQVTSVDPLTGAVTLSKLMSKWVVGTELNSMSQDPNFKITNPLTVITNVSLPTIFLSSVEGISVGDYLTEYGYSAIPQIPVEAHAYLAQLTAEQCLLGLGYADAAKMAAQKAEQLKEGIINITSNRVDGSPKKIVNPNGGMRFGSSLWGVGGGYGLRGF